MDKIVKFRIDDEYYAIPLLKVTEFISSPDQVTKIPLSEPYFKGIINLRGKIVGLITTWLKDVKQIMIAQEDNQYMGLEISAVEAVVYFDSDQIESESGHRVVKSQTNQYRLIDSIHDVITKRAV